MRESDEHGTRVARRRTSPTNITAETFVAESVKEERLVPSYKYTHMFSLLLTTFLKTSVRARTRPSSRTTRRDPDEFPGWRLSHRELGDTIRWPMSANFAVTRDMVRIRTRSFYDAILRLTVRRR